MAVKNSQRFAEIERLMGDYFGCHLAPRDGQGATGLVQQTGRRDAGLLQQYSWHPTLIGHCQYAW